MRLFVTPWTAAHQASLSITKSWSLLKLMCIESMMPSNHLILCRALLFLPSIFPSIKVFSIESVLHIRWQKYWSFSFSISPSNEYSGLISFKWTGWISSQPKGLSRVFSNTQFKIKYSINVNDYCFCSFTHSLLSKVTIAQRHSSTISCLLSYPPALPPCLTLLSSG